MKKLERCFVIMPFSDTRHGKAPNERIITKKQWEHVYERWIKKAVESYKGTRFVCKRSPAKPGSFIKGIVGDIATADLVIADLTGGRPNVYYELGIRHALRTGSVIITQDLSALPSDLSGYFAFEYTYSERDYEYEEHFRNFENTLHKTIAELERGDDPSDSPVSDFLGLRHQLLERTAEEEIERFEWLLQTLGEALAHNYQICEEFFSAVALRKEADFSTIPIVDTYPLEVLYNEILSTPWRIIKPRDLSTLAALLTHQRHLFMFFQRMMDKALIGKIDDSALAETVTLLAQKISDSRKRHEKEWKNILKSKIKINLVWKPNNAKTDSGSKQKTDTRKQD